MGNQNFKKFYLSLFKRFVHPKRQYATENASVGGVLGDVFVYLCVCTDARANAPRIHDL